ncbi:MAG TPA: Gfo/Idh/MocA family oxidoreductase [Candidatus Nanopusillus sp.]|nr:Gfo/Idh/MocA family oxidoreductase [Candidatus Nanopusillus sp.]
MKVGVIGVGVMGRNHVRIYSELRGIDEIYIYDIDRTVLKKVCEQFEVIACDSAHSLLKRVDAVSICVPTKYHFEIAKLAIENDVSCLIEKPVTSTSREGEELLKIAKNKEHLTIGVGHIERFNPVVKEIKNLIKDPMYIEIRRHNPASSRITDTSVVIDLMIHDIDLVWNYLLNCKDKFELYSIGNDNIRKVIVKFGDCIVSLSASRVACKKIRRIYIEEEEFTIDGNFMTQELYIYRKPKKYKTENVRYTQENIIEKVLVSKVEPLREELKTFIKCVKEGKQFPVTLEQGILNLKIAEKIEGL